MSKKVSISLLLFGVMTVLFSLGFYRNQWKAAGKKWFYDWKENSDIMVVGRLVQSRQQGALSNGALLGWGDITWPITKEMYQHQFDTYLNEEEFKSYFPYNSTIGAQGVIFSLIDQITDFAPAVNLKLFRGITSVLSAIAFSLIATWFFSELGFLSSLLVVAFVMFSEWLALYGGSIYWQLWSFYVPMIGVAVYFLREQQETQIQQGLLLLIVVLSTVIKGLFSGFEFITTSLTMMAVPVFYYAFLRKWKLRTFLRVGLTIALGAFLGTLICLIILSSQITAITGSFQGAWDYIFISLGKRSVGDPSQFSGVIAESLRANVWSVLRTYIFEGRAINLSNLIPVASASNLQSLLEIQYYKLFIVFALFSIAFILLARQDKKSNSFFTTQALLYTTWLSILPSLSWLILFKAHSYIHTQLNYIVWQMPFTVFGFALCGTVITYFISLRKNISAIPAPKTKREQPAGTVAIQHGDSKQ